MSDTPTYDAVIIGSGQGGNPLARELANHGWRTALIERGLVGGTCINVGCTPTKTLAAAARVAYVTGRSSEYGISTGAASVDMSVVRRRVRRIVDEFRSSTLEGLETTDGLDLIRGQAGFVDPRTLEISASGHRRRIRGEQIVIDTGGRPAIPPVEGIDDVDFLTSESILEIDFVPDHLVVLGGGYVGLEFAQMFRRFGSKVTIIQRAPKLLPSEDDDVAEEMAKILRGDGIEILLSSEAVAVRRESRKAIAVTTDGGPDRQTVTGSHLLVAAGRRPNSDHLRLEAAGVETESEGYITVNGRLQTSADGIYAIGDVKGGPAFTHISYDDFRILSDNLLRGQDRTIHDRIVPYTVFTDPQLGRVGLTEETARKNGRRIRIARLPMSRVARAREIGEARGLMKAVVDARTKQILGAAILGPSGGEIASLLQTAMMGNVPYTDLRDTAFAHPTFAESLNNLFAALD